LRFAGRAAAAALFICATESHAVTLRYASQQDPVTVDPHAANLLVSARLTQQIFDTSKPHILTELSQRVQAAGDESGRVTLLIGENEPQDSRLVAPADEGGCGLDALWNDDFHHSAMVALTGRDEAYYSGYRGSAQEFISVAKYGPSGAGALTSPMIRDDGHALTIAKRLVKFTKDSRYRFWDYQLMAIPSLIATLVTLDYSDLITVNGRDYNIVSLQHTRKGGEAHMTAYTLEEHIPHAPPFKIGSSRIAPAANTPGYDVVVG